MEIATDNKVIADFWRQLDIVNPNELDMLGGVTLIGAGGIGSPTALALTKMGITNLSVYDDDEIDNHNIPNQLYKLNGVGQPKVECLKELCLDFSGVEITANKKRFDLDGTNLSGIVISAVDSMESRIEIWNLIKFKPLVTHYIDSRMAAEIAVMYTICPTNLSDIKMYEENLFPDEESVETRCTEHSIIYNVFGIASFIANQIKRIAKNETYYKEIILDYKTPMLLVN